ncbi:MAG: hypothetical protein P9X22_00550 [Candidatus Zapsychrus exili]|nr:hypothetical protein [Candidatus Zapsychrus exili]
MTNEQFKEKFKVVSEEIKKSLNWEIDYTCPNCGHKSREDAFNAIEITASLSNWDCPDCITEQKGVYRDADETYGEIPKFRELMKIFQLHFLDGYLHALLVSQDRDICLYFEADESEPTKPLPAFLYDLSSAVVKIYTALEVYLSYQIRRQLQERRVEEGIIDLILIDKRPIVRDYFEMWKKLGIWNSLGERINEKELKKLKKMKDDEFFLCQQTRNKIVHYGKQASPENFLEVFASVGRFIADSHKHL